MMYTADCAFVITLGVLRGFIPSSGSAVAVAQGFSCRLLRYTMHQLLKRLKVRGSAVTAYASLHSSRLIRSAAAAVLRACCLLCHTS
jgi:hypothetical protein